MDTDEWVAAAEQRIMELLDSEGAAVWPEVVARISEPSDPTDRIEPHHLHPARGNLESSDHITHTTQPSSGQRPVTVWHPANLDRRRTRITTAARRKRALYSRYLAWAQGSPSRPGIIGPAAERVVHESLREAAPYGYRLLHPTAGEVRRAFGDQVPLGPLDNGAHLTVIDDQDTPQTAGTILVEVKNTRDWIHARSELLHQLLAKAALLQRAYPHRSLLPVLVCRRAQYLTFQLASSLGFMVVQLERQPVLSDPRLDARPGDRHYLNEVRRELDFLDLYEEEGPDTTLVNRLVRTIPQNFDTYASRWKAANGPVADLYHQYTQSRGINGLRALGTDQGFERLRQAARDAGARVRW